MKKRVTKRIPCAVMVVGSGSKLYQHSDHSMMPATVTVENQMIFVVQTVIESQL